MTTPHRLRVLVFPWLLAFAMITPSLATADLKIAAKDDGIQINAGTFGGFTLEYPTMLSGKQKPVHPITEKTHDGQKATVHYEGGTTLEISVDGDGTVTYAFSDIPQDATTFKVQTLIDSSFSDGGTWKIGGGQVSDFPKDKPAKPHLFQGNGPSLTIANSQKQVLIFGVPPYSYLQLVDNREWGWKTFVLQSFTTFGRGQKTYQWKITQDVSEALPTKVLVDKLGQSTDDFPDKVKSEDELKADVESEKAYYASLNPPAVDAYGGLPDSGVKFGLKKTGFFHVEQAKVGDKSRWFMVDPDGNAYFHLGVCCFQPNYNSTFVRGRENVYEWLPSIKDDQWKATFGKDAGDAEVNFHATNIVRKYGAPFDRDDFSARMIDRVRKFGFNAGGAFGSPGKAARDKATFPCVSGFPVGPYDGVPELPGVSRGFDPFDEKIRARVDQNFAKSVAKSADDPLIIGYFLSNEPLLENLPRVIPSLKGKYACKQKLVEAIKAKYATIDDFNTAWGLSIKSFDDLADTGLAVTTHAAADDVNAFVGVFLDTYFQLLADTFHKYDHNHMLIGNRLQSGTINSEQLCKISAKYMDLISFNYYTYTIEKPFLDRIYGWTDKPMMLSEFYFDSPSDSGLPGGGKDVSSQDERGLAYRNYVEHAASLDYIVGIEWFTLVDASRTGVAYGKYGGENPNDGLFSVADRPWKAMLSHMIQTNYDIYNVMLGQRPAFVYDNPKFSGSGAKADRVISIPHATGPIKLDGGSGNWPGTPAEQIASSRVVQGAKATGAEASFKLCWDDDKLYLLANVTDPTPMKNDNNPDWLWSGDAVELFVGSENPEQDGALIFSDRQVIMAGSDKPKFFYAHAPQGAPGDCELFVQPNVDGKGYTLEAAIPFKSLGFDPKLGQTIRFDLGLDDSANGKARLCQLMWNGTERNSGDRTGWGKARLVSGSP